MDEQVELLRGIWNEMKALNGRVDLTNAALHDEVGGLRAEFKEEIGGLHSQFQGLRTQFGEQLGGLRAELKEEIGGLRAELKEEIGGLRADFGDQLGGLRTELTGEVRRNVERDLRLGTAVAELSLDVRELTGVVHAWREEHRIDREDLRERVARLERRVGIEPR